MIAEISAEAIAHYTLQLPGAGMTEEEFFRFCELNDELRIERDSNGKILIMAPLHTESGRQESLLIFLLSAWNQKAGLGEVFSSSAGFTLPNGAMRSPDVSWILKERYTRLPKAEKLRFARITPDFVIELRSSSDVLSTLQAKMEEWLQAGCRLGFLIDPFGKQAYIFRQGKDVAEKVDFNRALSGEDVLPGFELDLKILND